MASKIANTFKFLGCSCAFGCLGFVVSVPIFILTSYLCYNIYYWEERVHDKEGDYCEYENYLADISCNGYWITKYFSGTWVIETPYFFVHDTKDVGELENWRECKLIISASGSYELIQPPDLLVRLLSERIDLEKNEEELVNIDNPADLLPENGTLHGEWSGHSDYRKRAYFNFRLSKGHAPIHAQIVEAREEEVKKQRLDSDRKLHWSTCSSFDYPKEGIVWKKLPVEIDESAQKPTDDP